MPERNRRLISLDGLRGIAALIVLVHHSMMVIPSIANVYFSDLPIEGLRRAISYTPLHLLWAGPEAVYLFFVLSGLVLAFQTQRPGFDWGKYYPSRLIRLYLPVMGAVIFAAATIVLVSRDVDSLSIWIRNHPRLYTFSDSLLDVTLVGGISWTISPLWSLMWEVFFSLLLPVYIAVAHKIKPWLVILGSIVLVTVGVTSHNQVLQYLPMFAIGVALAHAWPALQCWAERVQAHQFGWLVWLCLTAASSMLTVTAWLLAPLGRDLTIWAPPFIVLGVTGFVLVGAFSPVAKWLLSLRPILWLGTVSFSLYLTHEPIVVAFGHLLPSEPRLATVAAILVALPAAWVFYRCVEKPAHRLAQRVAGRKSATEDRPVVVLQ